MIKSFNNFNKIKNIVEAELKVDFCELIEDETFKRLLKHSLKTSFHPINASAQLINYIKNHYQTR